MMFFSILILNFIVFILILLSLSYSSPIVTFLSPEECGVVQNDHHNSVYLSAEIRNIHNARVILQIDGTIQFEPSCINVEPCQLNIAVMNLSEGWHGLAVLFVFTNSPQFTVKIPYANAPFSFYVDQNTQERFPPLDLYIKEPLGPRTAKQSDVSPSKIIRQYVINVIAFDRPEDLKRLLDSLLKADYDTDVVSLRIHIDSAKPDSSQERIEGVQAVLKLAVKFHWPHGPKSIHKKVKNNGVTRQWLEAWTPSSDDDIGFFFEEDLEVSPAYFKWVKTALENYESTSIMDRLFGFCLQRNWLVPARYLSENSVLNGYQPFLYQVLGPLGFCAIGSTWMQFIAFYEEMSKDSDFVPLVPGLWTNEWLKGPSGHAMWTSWFDRFAFDSGTFCLYANLPVGQALTINHAGPGLHYKRQKKNGVDAVLVDLESSWAQSRLFFFPDSPLALDFSARVYGAPTIRGSQVSDRPTLLSVVQSILVDYKHPKDHLILLCDENVSLCWDMFISQGSSTSLQAEQIICVYQQNSTVFELPCFFFKELYSQQETLWERSINSFQGQLCSHKHCWVFF